jgi:hypothetical protein
MDVLMKNVLLGTLTFLLVSFVPGMALSILAMLSSPVASKRPDPTGDLLMVLIYYGTTNGLRTLGFLIPTALSPAWRRWSTKRALITSAILGFTSPITSLLGLALIVQGVLPLFQSAPWLAMGLSSAVPGLFLGLFAIGIATFWPISKPK